MEKFYNVQLQDYIISNGTPVWVVCDVHPQRNYTLLLTFASGEKRIYNALPLLEKEIYAPLKNLNFFMQARVEGDSVVWSDEIDIAPEHLYKCSLPTKEMDN